MVSAPLRAGSGPEPLGKVDRWLVRYLTLSAFLYACTYVDTYVFHNSSGIEYVTVFLAGIAVLKAATVSGSISAYQGRATVIISVLVPLAIFNSLISLSQVETSLRWVLWLVIVISLTKVTNASDGSWLAAAIRRMPFLFAMIWVTIFIVARMAVEGEQVAFAYHLSGLYGNLTLATGLFATKLWQRMIWVPLGFFAIFASGAGGALFTIPIMFVPYILYSTRSMPVKGAAIASMLVLGGLFFFESQLFAQFLDIKIHVADTNDASGLERLERSRDMRFELVQYGIGLVKQHPGGTGLGHTYMEIIGQDMGVGHVHNGTLTMLIELGIPGFAIVVSLMLWMFWNILRSPLVDNTIKGFYFTYFFTCFGRSLSENYTPFDLGNFFNLVFLIFTVSLFLCQRESRRNQQPADPRRRPYPMRSPMPPTPRWNRPVGVR